jgi:endonuclease/exonuclease/phosphatase family metal-dependent hydrolase
MDYRDSKSRVVQSGELVQLLRGIKGPAILTGDFNASPGTTEILNLQTVLTDTGDSSDFTFPAVKPKSKIDFVMVTKDHLVKVKKVQVFPVVFSDHLPVMSTVKIKQ